jgi:beta-glucanase (GH16 family)
MKKYIKNLAIVFSVLFAFSACQNDDSKFGDINAPNGIEVQSVIKGVSIEFPDGDGSGKVDFVATANNATNYKYIFSDGTEINSPSGIVQKGFNNTGTNTYTVTVLASGTAGVSSSMSFEITVYSNFKDDEAVNFLTGGTSKKWYFAANEIGHLGVGPNNDLLAENAAPIYYAAAPFEKAGSPDSACLYNNELTFTLVEGVLKYELDNGGNTFYNSAFHNFGNSDLCLPLNTSGQKTVVLSPSESILTAEQSRKTAMTFSNSGFMGYYINQTTYEIVEITENRMVVRAVMGSDSSLVWYHTFTTVKPEQDGDEPDEDFVNLVWGDEFNVAGAPNTANWGYDIGAGGWGNGEEQFYRNNADNVKVEGGFLKITAKKQNFSGSSYTSARIKTEGKQNFTYGKIEARMKLPQGVGTWPAFWMLGSNFSQVSWPSCGEIDIMEHKGFEPNIIHATLHYPGFSGGGGPTQSTTITNVSSEFHIYSVVWTATTIKFYVDNVVFHTFNNNANTPFNADFFIIFNVAMGGTFGGPVDANFVQSTMEVDYVRVYQ